MGRLVDPRQPGPHGVAGGNDKDAAQDYLERISKYVPAEILAAYLTGLPVIAATTKEGETLRTILYGALLLVCLVFTPIYLNFMADPKKPKRLHLFIGSLALIIWAYSIGGFFTVMGWYHTAIGTLALLIFSLASGLIAPTTGTK